MITIVSEGKNIGSVTIANGIISFSHDFIDMDLAYKIQGIEKEGLPYFVYADDTKSQTAILKKSFPIDPEFIIHLMQYVKKEGYEIIEEETLLRDRMLILLKRISNDEDLKKNILVKFPTMTYLEKTLLIYQLEQI